MPAPLLVTIDVRFTTSDDPEQLAERVREAIRMVVGRDAVEHFRWRTEPTEPPKDRIHPR
jgi:acetylornithine deacetylase/succinyl-diaminopimelate desuccinylase-like protein